MFYRYQIVLRTHKYLSSEISHGKTRKQTTTTCVKAGISSTRPNDGAIALSPNGASLFFSTCIGVSTLEVRVRLSETPKHQF